MSNIKSGSGCHPETNEASEAAGNKRLPSSALRRYRVPVRLLSWQYKGKRQSHTVEYRLHALNEQEAVLVAESMAGRLVGQLATNGTVEFEVYKFAVASQNIQQIEEDDAEKDVPPRGADGDSCPHE